VQLPDELPRTLEGVPIVNRPVPLRISVAPHDQSHLLQRRFELVLYVDTVFLHEEEEGYSPFMYLFDPSTVSPGPHLFTINLLSFDDHIGVATQPILVEY
jgi:hypothetical protein